MNIHKSQLFWCELQGYKVLTHCRMIFVQAWCGLVWWSEEADNLIPDSRESLQQSCVSTPGCSVLKSLSYASKRAPEEDCKLMKKCAKLSWGETCKSENHMAKLRTIPEDPHPSPQSLTWQCVKTVYPCSSHQNSWDLWMFIPLKMVLIGIDPYPNGRISSYPVQQFSMHILWSYNVVPPMMFVASLSLLENVNPWTV